MSRTGLLSGRNSSRRLGNVGKTGPVCDRDWLWSDYAREDDPYTAEERDWFGFLEEVDRDYERGMYDEEECDA